MHADIQIERTLVTVASTLPMDNEDKSYVQNLFRPFSNLARSDEDAVLSLSANLKPLVIDYCGPKLRKDLGKGLELLMILKDGELLKETWERKQNEIASAYVRRAQKRPDAGVESQHVNNMDGYFNILVENVTRYYRSLSLCADDCNPRQQTLWKATTQAAMLHSSPLFGIISEFVSDRKLPETTFGGKDWVAKVKKHLKRAGMYHMAVQTLITTTQKSQIRAHFANL
ncbi:hypothetical protein HK102_006034 [Quaeritorhiza haematococci]|nr:hypothetical protein HK102_006034 [Quaeritorhiza haematococci]